MRKTEFYFIDYIFHLFFLHESEFEPLVHIENQMVARKY